MAFSLRRLLPLLLGAACLVFVAACGDDNDDSASPSESTPAAAPPADTTSTPASGGGSGAGGNLKIGAVEGGATPFSFDPKNVNTSAGKVTFTLDNPAANQAPHAIEVEGNGVEKETDTIQPGNTTKLSIDLKPGKYEFYCPVDGHRDAGMEGTLVVK